MKKVVLAYSGGLDTSVAVAWLKEQFDTEVVTLTVDVGGGSLREGVERRAMSAGASRAYVVGARERFVTDFVWPHLQANAPFQWTVDPADAPNAVEIMIEFEGGIPVAVDGERLDPVSLVNRVSTLAGQHGVGRIDHVEDRLVGIKSREIYEAPAAVVLHTAHRALEGLTLTRDTLRFNQLVADELARLTYDGLWFSALHRDLRGYAASSQRVVSGEVRIRLDHGSAVVAGRRSPLSLYDKSLATYDEGDAFDHAAAVGFIEIFGLPLRVEAARHGAVGRFHGAAWSWTDPLLEHLPTTVKDPEPAAV